MVLTLAQMFSRRGRIRLLARRRSLGTRAISVAAIPAARMTARMIQTAAWLPPEPVGAWKVPAANGMSIDSITLSDGRSGRTRAEPI